MIFRIWSIDFIYNLDNGIKIYMSVIFVRKASVMIVKGILKFSCII
mgnify:CR=1 FL=1